MEDFPPISLQLKLSYYLFKKSSRFEENPILVSSIFYHFGGFSLKKKTKQKENATFDMDKKCFDTNLYLKSQLSVKTTGSPIPGLCVHIFKRGNSQDFFPSSINFFEFFLPGLNAS